MSVQRASKVSFVRSIIIAAIVVAVFALCIFFSALLIKNDWGKLTLIILAIGAALLNVAWSLATWRTTESSRTAAAMRLGVAILLVPSMALDGARLLHYNLPVPDLPYTLVCWLFLIAINLANNTWGKGEWRQVRQFLISMIIVVGGIFAWVSLIR